MADKKVRLTRKKRIAQQNNIIANPATSVADRKRAKKELERLEALPKGKPRGKPFQRKAAPESPGVPVASGELPPGPATADNSRRQREAMEAAGGVPSPQQQAVEQIHNIAETRKVAEKKAADDLAMREAQAWASMKRAEAEAAMVERGIIEDPLAPAFINDVRLTNALLAHWSDPPPPPPKPKFKHAVDNFGIRVYPPFGGERRHE